MATWSPTAATVAAPARSRPQAAPRRRAQARPRRLTGGIFWIVLLGVLLAGVVALSVGVLRLNMGLDKLDRERTQLRAENAALQSQLSSAAAAPRLQAKALRLGLVPAPAQDTTYVRLTRR
jgi:ABC-type Fe3+ transport system permease subunit